MRKKILATGGVVITILLTGRNAAFAQTTASSAPIEVRMEAKQGKIVGSRMNLMASKLGMSAKEVKQELQSGKTFKQILAEHGITVSDARHKIGNGKWPTPKHTFQ